MGQRVLAIGLDGFEITLAERFVGEGLMPHFARLAARSVRYTLDHGADKFSGLAWEHVSSGRAPSDGARWSAVTFDKNHYTARQESTSYRPFLADVPLRSVVFDMPYCDLLAAPNVRGLTSWGAHDPGVAALSTPRGLHTELAKRFGPYPASDWVYGFTWPSPERTRDSAAALVRAVHLRAQAARWLLAERLTDWDLGLVVVSEPHSAIEPLWHGVDTSHPLHGLPSAKPAGEGLRAVYGAVDDLIGTLCEAFPEAIVVPFAMHGMGRNDADVATMVLLPELLHRNTFGRAHMREGNWPGRLPDGTPLMPDGQSWEDAIAELVPRGAPPRAGFPGFVDRLRGWRLGSNGSVGALAWMPATRYQGFWPRMPAFALPAYYDGRVRVNLAGREARGTVEATRYRATLDSVATLLAECRDSITGREVVDDIQIHTGDPSIVGPSQSDMTILWRGTALGLDHPRLGRIGPLPWRRTGGHTGDHGFLYILGTSLAPHDAGAGRSFDVVPTMLALAGAKPPPWLSGRVLREFSMEHQH